MIALKSVKVCVNTVVTCSKVTIVCFEECNGVLIVSDVRIQL